MAKKNTKPKTPHSGRRGDPVSLYPLTPEQAIKGMFAISPADIKKVLASKPEQKKK